MYTVKLSIFIACSMGVISTLTDIILPDDSMKKQFRSLLGLISLLAVISPWISDGFILTLDAPFTEDDISFFTETAENDLNDIFLRSAENEYDEYLCTLLNNNDIRAASAETYMTLDADGEITVSKLTVKLYDISQQDDALMLLKEQLPEADIEILAVENERTDKSLL